jgi:hypothetical protein
MNARRALLVAVSGLLAGCGQLLYRTTHLRSFDQRLAHAYGVHEVIIQTVPQAVTIGHITEANGALVIKLADQAREVLELARTLDLDGHGVAADQSMQLGWMTLHALDEFLKGERPLTFLKVYSEAKPD